MDGYTVCFSRKLGLCSHCGIQVTPVTSFNFCDVAIQRRFSGLVTLLLQRNIVQYLFRSSNVQYYVQMGFETPCPLPEGFIIQQTFDHFSLSWKFLFEEISIVVHGSSFILLDVSVCSMSIPVLSISALTLTISRKVPQFVTSRAFHISTARANLSIGPPPADVR